jgi:SNW domain-containing protein 1
MLHLPPPKNGAVVEDVGSDDEEDFGAPSSSSLAGASSSAASSSSSSSGRSVPPYGRRRNFLPKRAEDFGDGGAFPEIHVLQYPLDMGRPGTKSSALVSVDVDEHGKVRYDAIVKTQGANSTKIVRSSISDVKGGAAAEDKVALPGQDEAAETARRTHEALQALVEGKQAKSAPTIRSMAAKEDKAQYIRYESNPDAPGYNPDVGQRVIRMVEAQVDPMEPPRHKVQKAVRGPGSPPVPVLHSPSRKLSKEEEADWKIPPVVSNWKNSRGFTIPLDKRLAADGRHLQEHTINNKFATLAEALYITERKAADDLRVRAQLRKQLAMKEKEDREAELREMAASARHETTSTLADIAGYGSDSDGDNGGSEDRRPSGGARPTGARAVSNLPAWMTEANKAKAKKEEEEAHATGGAEKLDEDGDSSGDERGGGEGAPAATSAQARAEALALAFADAPEAAPTGETADESVSRQERERVRNDQRKERERELRQEARKGKRKNKDDRDDGRDVGEKMALGVHTGATKLSGEGMFDSRLFNQTSGIGQGFGADDEYNQFDKPLFERGEAATSIYKPTASDGDLTGAAADAAISKMRDTGKFKPDVGFAGAGGADTAGHVRSEPVQFERAGTVQEADPFGLDAVMGSQKAKRTKR